MRIKGRKYGVEKMKRTKVHCRHSALLVQRVINLSQLLQPGSPWQSSRLGSFNSRLGDEPDTRELFDLMWGICYTIKKHRNN